MYTAPDYTYSPPPDCFPWYPEPAPYKFPAQPIQPYPQPSAACLAPLIYAALQRIEDRLTKLEEALAKPRKRAKAA